MSNGVPRFRDDRARAIAVDCEVLDAFDVIEAQGTIVVGYATALPQIGGTDEHQLRSYGSRHECQVQRKRRCRAANIYRSLKPRYLRAARGTRRLWRYCPPDPPRVADGALCRPRSLALARHGQVVEQLLYSRHRPSIF